AGASPVYISVGRLVPYKNPLRVLDIFCRAEKENPSARLIYIGDGILRAPLLARAGSLGIRERLVYMPRVAFEKIPGCYAAADYFVSACDTEGFGLAALESLMCGCRALLPKSGAFPEIFRDKAFFYGGDYSFDKNPPDEKTVNDILSSFTWDRSLARWDKAYREAVR
ncbi:MAG: glycosyltransferase, partial [Spirochaetota bacterium]